MSRHFTIGLLVFAAAALAVSGCGGSKPARFYLLQTAASDAAGAGGDAGDLTLIGLLPMGIPDYLMRPQIASRGEGNRLEYAEYDRWAEPLLDTLMRLVSVGLSRALPGHLIVAYPWVANLEIEYRVHVTFRRFDLCAGGSAELRAVWAFGEGRQGPWARFGTIELTETFEEGESPDYPARVAALDRLVVRMNRELAEELRAFLSGEEPR